MSHKTYTLHITDETKNKRIDALCGKTFPEFSRTVFAKHATFLCDNKPATYKQKTKTDETWIITLNTSALWNPEKLEPWNHPLTIIAESDSWAVVEKPAGISVHPSPSEPEQKTMLNILLHHFENNLSHNTDTLDGHTMQRPGLVHRLDKTTSGLLLIAKTNAAHRFFQNHWHTKTKKFYTAIVHGIPKEEGIIDAPLARDPSNKTKMKPQRTLKAKPAKTHFWRQKTNDNLSQLNVELYTGRTHQIRAHLSSIGFPILGDTKYGGQPAERVFLHARELSFPDPDTNGTQKTITSQIPPIFLKKLNK